MGRVSGRALLIGTAVVLLTGCTTAPPTDQPSISEPPIGAIGVITNPDLVLRPIDEYKPSPIELLAINQQYERLVNECLSAHQSNLRIAIANDPTQLLSFIELLDRDDRTMMDLLYFFDPENASVYGYHRPPSSAVPITGFSPSADIVDQCSVAVNSVTPGGGESLPFLALPDGGPTKNSADSRYVAAVAQWSTCMKAQGYDYADPLFAIYNPQWLEFSVASPDEIATAVADVRCKVSVNFVGQVIAIQSAYDQLYIDSHHDELVALRQQIADYIQGNVVVPPIQPLSTKSGTPSDLHS